MSDVSGAADVGGDEPVSVVSIPKETNASTAMEAARALIDARRKRDEPAAAANEPAPKPTDPVDDTGDAPREAAPVETAEDATDTQAEPAAIDPPRSWTKEAKEQWQSLPRETQEYLAAREQERDRAVRQSQNEAAEKLKGLTAKEQAVEQARQHYEQALPTLQQQLQSQLMGQYSDIKTMADVETMAANDWPRYIQWDAAQKKLAAVTMEAQAAQQRQQQESQQKRASFFTEQDKLFIERAPEMADKATAAKVGDAAIKMLKDTGFTDEELGSLWNGDKELSLRDHRAQLLIRDALKYREAHAKAKVPAPKAVPQVQRPGVSRPRGAGDADRVESLTTRLEKTGNAKDAAALLMARRAARA